jgi:predicted DNA-binding transcriptional regulator YafY
MSRAQRLLDLLQLLRSYRFPVAGQTLAQELGISLRTLYRDIASLQEQGASITGEAGMGYVLKPGFMLPPLMFSEEEIEALVLGSRWVTTQKYERLAVAAKQALHKIAAVLPEDLRTSLDTNTLLIGPSESKRESKSAPDFDTALPLLRSAMRNERKVHLQYADAQGRLSQRVIWPFALGFFEHVRVLVAWCELRQEIRHFRTDRIRSFEVHDVRYPKRRAALLKQWREQEGIPTR